VRPITTKFTKVEDDETSPDDDYIAYGKLSPSQHADFLLAGTVVRHNENSWLVKSRVCSNPISIDLGVLRTPVDEAPRDMTAVLTVSNHAAINVAKVHSGSTTVKTLNS